MAERASSLMLREVAAELLEQLRALPSRSKIDNLPLSSPASVPTRRRAIYWLREIGAPISATPKGYKLDDPEWRMPAATVVRIVEVAPGVDEWIAAATTGDLVEALEAKGYEVTIRKVCKPDKGRRATAERPSLLELGKGHAA